MAPSTRVLRSILPVGILALLASTSPASAFQPAVPVLEGDPGARLTLTDLTARGVHRVASVEAINGSDRDAIIRWSTDSGATWLGGSAAPGQQTREPQTTICDGHAVVVFTTTSDGGVTWTVASYAAPLDGGSGATRFWPTSGNARKPDTVCVANSEVAVAWFERHGSSYHVRLRTRAPQSAGSSPQSFDLGAGSVGRGLAIAASADRLYVTWFDGNALKLRRFRIGTSARHDLTSLGTTTLATLRYGLYPRIGAHGDRVILAYMDKASLKVRRSTNNGAAFGSARTIRSEAFPGEIGAYPTTVAIVGSTVAIGGVEIQESGGKGLGYLSTDGGFSYRQVATHASGRTAATLVRVGSGVHYAEAWDQSISDPIQQLVRYRRR